MSRTGQIVIVWWGDAHGQASWTDDASIAKDHRPAMCVTAGFLVKSDEAGVTIASGFSEDADDYMQSFFIPRGMIQKIKQLKAKYVA